MVKDKVIINGANKSKALYDMIKGGITEKVPASVLQKHPDCTLTCYETEANLINQLDR